MRIADTNAENTPQIDVFKQVHVPKALKNQVSDKVQNASSWKPTEMDVSGPQIDPLKRTKKAWSQAEAN